MEYPIPLRYNVFMARKKSSEIKTPTKFFTSRQTLLVLLCIFVSVALLYGGTLKNGFIHDDHGQVENNTYIQSLMYLPKVFTSCIWASAVGNCKETYYYRPLQNLSYMITYQFSSHPWIFHVVNLIYFSLDIWLVYLVIQLLTGDMPLALLTAGLFFIHPLNTEVVNWIATVPELLFVLFILLSTYYFILYRRNGRKKYLWGTLVSYTLSILAKEPAVFLPFVWLVLDFSHFNRKLKDFFQWKTVKPYVFSVAIFFVYLGLRLYVLGGLGADPTQKYTLPQRIYTFIYLFGSYIRKLVYPNPLNLFYTYHRTYNIMQPGFIADTCILAVFAGLFIAALVKKWKIVSFSLVWFLAFLAPSLIFINSIGENLFAERHVFASTIGFTLLLSLGLSKLWHLRRWGRTTLIILLSVVSVSSFILIYQRNKLWRSDETIYADTLTKSPDADLIRYNLAYLYEQSGRADKAKEQYSIIAKRHTWRGLDKVYNNLGDMARKAGNFEQASLYFQQSLAINPLHVEAYNNLGAMAFAQGDLLDSLTLLCQANRIDPSFQAANNNYDKLVSTIGGMDEKTFDNFYQSLLTGGMFHEVDNKNQFVLDNKTCTSDSCLYTFSIHSQAGAFVFPYLIAGESDSNQIIRPHRMGIRQATGDIVLDIDLSLGSQNLRFTLPTCDRTYLQVTAGANE